MLKRMVYMFALVLATGCAGMGKESVAKQAPTPEAVQAAIQEAEAAIKKTDSVGYLWRDTEKLLKAAKAAAKKGELEKALELAGKARRQAELAYQQYLSQKNAGPRF